MGSRSKENVGLMQLAYEYRFRRPLMGSQPSSLPIGLSPPPQHHSSQKLDPDSDLYKISLYSRDIGPPALRVVGRKSVKTMILLKACQILPQPSLGNWLEQERHHVVCSLERQGSH